MTRALSSLAGPALLLLGTFGCGGGGAAGDDSPELDAAPADAPVELRPGSVLSRSEIDRAFATTLSAERGIYQLHQTVRIGLDAAGDVGSGTALRGEVDGDRVVVVMPPNTQVATPPRYCRYDLTTRALDPTFGTAGCVSAPRAYFSSHGIAKTPTGYRAIVQRQCSSGCPDAERSFGLIAMSESGVIDQSFGTEGILFSSVLPDLSALAFAAQSTGDLVITGYTGLYNMKLFRIHADGSLDTSFGTDGFIVGANGGRVSVLADDTILLESTYNGTERIDRFTSSGQPLPGFGSNGGVDLETLTASQFDHELNLRAADVDASGRVVVAYSRRPAEDAPYQHFVLRLAADGTPDTTFGASGTVRDLADTVNDLTGVGFAADGTILVGTRLTTTGRSELVQLVP